MANQTHLDLLKRAIGPGYPVELWNQWRAANPGLQPDLSGARLEGAYLVNVNLSGGNFSGAELMGARIRTPCQVLCKAQQEGSQSKGKATATSFQQMTTVERAAQATAS